MRFYTILKALFAALFASLLVGCNDEGGTSSVYLDYGTFAITGFSLHRDTKNSGLDSVYFAIDTRNGVIFNADSLKKGTPVNKIVTDITYDEAVDSVLIIMEGGSTRTGRVNYKTNPTDSIDYTGKVTILLKSGELSKQYLVKLNVHNESADSLYWDEADVRQLPSRLPDPVAQKTILTDDNEAVTLIRESDGSYTFAHSDDAYQENCVKAAASLPFTPRVESFNDAAGKLYLLSDTGSLWTSDDLAQTWSDTGQVWDNMIGAYLETVVGIRNDGAGRVFAQYPVRDINATRIPSDFPVSGFSNFVTLSNKWTLSPVAFFMGGQMADGKLSPATWAFDGTEWIRLNDGDIPAMEQASIIPYYYYRKSVSGTSYNEFNVWMLLGGRKADNTISRDVYISYDNGVSWKRGAASLQLPQSIPAMWGCDNIVVSSELSADLSDNWSVLFKNSAPRKLQYEVENDIITWECPYIYLMGGYGPDGKLYNTIWRGVLNRLAFTPII